MAAPPPSRLLGKLAVETRSGAFLGEARIRLLEAIEQHGSISQAAKVVPLSYKAAWDAVAAMNNLSDRALVERVTGGRHGGGASLTDHGRRLVAMYRALELEYQSALDGLSARLTEGDAGDVHRYQELLHRMSVRTSARNQFAGPVTALVEGPAGYEVRLRVDEGMELASIVTQHSVESLGLRLGVEVTAVFKAAAVRLEAETRRTAGGALRLRGSVARILKGPAHAEVHLGLPGGRVVVALATLEALARLRLRTGSACMAVVEPSSVILMRFA